MNDAKFQIFVPDWCKFAHATDWEGKEAEVGRIPVEEFADPDFTVKAEDFPETRGES